MKKTERPAHASKLAQTRTNALEQHFVLDAAAVSTLAGQLLTQANVQLDASMTPPDTLTSNATATLPVELRAIDPVLNRDRKEVAFIDTSIANYTTLVDGVQGGVEVVLLNADQDGVAQMALWAQTHSGYDAVHVLSHGSDGALKLGNMTLTSVNLNRHNAELAEIGKILNPQGDILIYGCNLAQGTAGAQFIGQLAQMTNADVAASKDNTGAAALGGNWTLELSTGAIETMGLPQDSEPFSRFGGLLAVIRPDLSSDSDSGSSYTDNITKVDTPVFTGKSGANFSIILYDTDGTTELGTTSADGSGAWSITSSKLTEGDHSITAKMTDIGGSSTNSSALVVTIDTTAPSASKLNLAPASDTGSSDSDGITTVTTPTFTGTAEAYATVNLFDSNGKTILGTTTASASSDWSIVSSALSATTHYVTSKVTDIAGNVSTASSKVTVVVDTVSPTLASDITISDTELKIGDTATVKFAFTEAVTGFETVDLTVSNGTLNSLTTSDSGKNWTATLSPAASTTVDSNVITLNYSGIADLAGNAGTGTSTSGNYAVDTASTPPSISNLSGDSVVWAGVGNYVSLDIGANATVSNTNFEALNAGNGEWNGATLTIHRVSGGNPNGISKDIFKFVDNDSFTLQEGNPYTDYKSQTIEAAYAAGENATGTLDDSANTGWFARWSYTYATGTLVIQFGSSSSGDSDIDQVASTALVQSVLRNIAYRNDTPTGDTTVRFTLSDGTSAGTADVTVASDTIYITNATDTATIDVSNGVSFSEAVAIAAADLTGTQTLVLASSFTSNVTSDLVADMALTENLTIRQEGSLRLGGSNTLTIPENVDLGFSGSGPTHTIYLMNPITGAGNIVNSLEGGPYLLFTSTANSGFTGNIEMASGSIQAESATAFGGATLVATNTSSYYAGIRNDYASTIANAINFDAGAIFYVGGAIDYTLSGAIDLGGVGSTGTFYVSGPTTTFSGVISNGSLSVDRGTAILSGTNTYDKTYIKGSAYSEVTIKIAGDSNLGTGAIYLSSSNLPNSTTSVLEITGSGVTIDNDIVMNAYNGGGTIKNDNNVTLSGQISEVVDAWPYKMYKTGAGTLTLSGTSNYNKGELNVEAGVVNITGALNNAATATIASGAAFGGSGAFGGATTVNSGGKLGIDGAVNVFTIDDNLVLSSGATYSVEINGTTAGTQHDQTVVNGAVNLTGATLSVSGSHTPVTGNSIVLIANDGSDAVSGTFTGLAEGATVTLNDVAMKISYVGGTGNDVVLAVESTSITSATYNASTGTLTVKGTQIPAQGDANDINASFFSIKGQDGETYTLTDTPNVERSSDTAFTLVLSETDRNAVNTKLNKAGTSSIDGTLYNLAAAQGWTAAVDSADLSGNGIKVDGFIFEEGAPIYTENGVAVPLASTGTLAFAAKDSLNQNAGNYNGTSLQASALSDLSTQINEIIAKAQEYQNSSLGYLIVAYPIIFSELITHELRLETIGKSFDYDAINQTLFLNDSKEVFARVDWGASEVSNILTTENANASDNDIDDFDDTFGSISSKMALRISFTSDLATTALVNEVLQSFGYINTQDAMLASATVTWTLKEGDPATQEFTRLLTGGSLVTLNSVNDAPRLSPVLNSLSQTGLIDFADQQSVGQDAGISQVYSSTGTAVITGVTNADALYGKFAPLLPFMSEQAGVLVGDLSFVDPDVTQEYSTITFEEPQTSVTLEFFNIFKTLANLSPDVTNDQISALTSAILIGGLPHRKVSYFNAENELLGISSVTRVEAPAGELISELFSRQISGDFEGLPAWEPLYTDRFTAPDGQTIASVRIESYTTLLGQAITGSGGRFPLILDRILFGEVTESLLNLPDLVIGTASEFVVGDIFGNDIIQDADIYMWSNAPKSIAVSAVDNTQGTWEYKIGDGAWVDFDFTEDHIGQAILLDASDSIRFTPGQDFNGVLSNVITFYAWDKTTGNAGEYLTLDGNTGGDKTLSERSIIASTSVLPANQAPILTDVPVQTQTVTVGAAAALADFTVADPDDTETNLNVTLVAINGTISRLTDADNYTPGIQISGTASQLNLKLADAVFTANAAGAARIEISVSDGIANPVTGTYNLLAKNPPATDPDPTPPPDPVPPPFVTIINPDGTTTVVSTTPGASATIPAPASGSTIVASSSGDTIVTNPGSTVILNNTGSGTVTTSGISGDTTLTLTGTGTQKVDLSGMKPGQILTIDNAGTGTVDLSNLPDGVIVKLLGTGPVTLIDNDGATASVENAAPALLGAQVGDGNGDGTPDALQSNVASALFLQTDSAQSNPGNASPAFVSLVADAVEGKINATNAITATLFNVRQLDAPANLPAEINMPMGLIAFSAALGLSTAGSSVQDGAPAVGARASFSLYVDPAIEANGYWKQDANKTWVNLASPVFGGQTVTEDGKTRLDFQITDGGEFDADGKVDGTITDPGAAASMPLSLVGYSPTLAEDTHFWF